MEEIEGGYKGLNIINDNERLKEVGTKLIRVVVPRVQL